MACTWPLLQAYRSIVSATFEGSTRRGFAAVSVMAVSVLSLTWPLAYWELSTTPSATPKGAANAFADDPNATWLRKSAKGDKRHVSNWRD